MHSVKCYCCNAHHIDRLLNKPYLLNNPSHYEYSFKILSTKNLTWWLQEPYHIGFYTFKKHYHDLLEQLPSSQFSPLYPGLQIQVPTIQVPWLLHVMSMHWLVGTSHSEPFQPLWHMQRPLRYWPFPLHSTGQAAMKRADRIHLFEWTPPSISSHNSECVKSLFSKRAFDQNILKVSCAVYHMQRKCLLPVYIWHIQRKPNNKYLIPTQRLMCGI